MGRKEVSGTKALRQSGRGRKPLRTQSHTLPLVATNSAFQEDKMKMQPVQIMGSLGIMPRNSSQVVPKLEKLISNLRDQPCSESHTPSHTHSYRAAQKVWELQLNSNLCDQGVVCRKNRILLEYLKIPNLAAHHNSLRTYSIKMQIPDTSPELLVSTGI